MKNIFKKTYFVYLLLLGILINSCSKDDPDGINEQEYISNVVLEIQAADGSNQTIDWDISEQNSQSINLNANVDYNIEISFLNNSDPTDIENVTLEIIEEADEHQVFFNASGVDIAFEYGDFDSNNNPLGVVFSMSTGNAGSGTITITLVHEPTKPNDGLDTAGGSIDIQTSFPVTIE